MADGGSYCGQTDDVDAERLPGDRFISHDDGSACCDPELPCAHSSHYTICYANHSVDECDCAPPCPWWLESEAVMG